MDTVNILKNKDSAELVTHKYFAPWVALRVLSLKKTLQTFAYCTLFCNFGKVVFRWILFARSGKTLRAAQLLYYSSIGDKHGKGIGFYLSNV